MESNPQKKYTKTPKIATTLKYRVTTRPLYIKPIIQSIATLIHSQMNEDSISGKIIPKGFDLHFFSEEKYIQEKPEEFNETICKLLRDTPSIDNICDFISAIYQCGSYSLECLVICQIYIKKFISFSGFPIHPTNWRLLVLCSFVVAQKIWDDKIVSNTDLIFISPFFVPEEIIDLQLKFIELLQYNVNIKSSQYVLNFFELRVLYDGQFDFPLTPLDNEQAKQLEERSIKFQNQQERIQKNSLTHEKN